MSDTKTELYAVLNGSFASGANTTGAEANTAFKDMFALSESNLKAALTTILAILNPNYTLGGLAYTDTDTPTATENLVFFVMQSGTVLGQTAVFGDILVGNGSNFAVQTITGLSEILTSLSGLSTNISELSTSISNHFSALAISLKRYNSNYNLLAITGDSSYNPSSPSQYDVIEFSADGTYTKLLDSDSNALEITNHTTQIAVYDGSAWAIDSGINPETGYTQWTGNVNYDKRIKNLYLIGLDSGKSYYIDYLLYRESDSYKIVYIYDSDGTRVCELSSPDDLLDDSYQILSETNSSGIYGYIFLDLSEYFSYTSMSAYLNYNLISTRNDEMKDFFESDFIERDDTIRRNKLNPSDIRDSKTLALYGGTQLLVTLTDSIYFHTIKAMPISAGESITISNISMYQCVGYIITENRKILQTTALSTNDVNAGITITNNTGVDAYFICNIRRTGVNEGEYHQIEYDTEASDYQAYLTEPIKENENDIVLPANNYVNVGDAYNIYKKNIVNRNPLDFINVVGNDASDSSFVNYMRQMYGLPTDSGSGTLNIRAFDNKKVLSRVYRNFIRVAKTTGTINLFCVGDSFTDVAQWIYAISENCTNDSVTLNLIGLKNADADYHNESQTGGTLGDSFLADRDSAFVLSVTGFTDDGTSDGYGAALFTDGSNGYYFDGRKVDSNGDGYIRIRPNNHTNVPSENGTLTLSSGTSNYSTISYGTVQTVNRNPIWNPNTSEIDFSYYLDLYGWSTDYDLENDKFVLALQFSWNDCSEYYDPDNIDEVVGNFKTAIDQFHTEYPNAYVIIGIEPTAGLFGGSKVTPRIVSAQWGRMEFAKGIFAQFETSDYEDFVFINPGYAYVDLENAFDATNVALSPRFPNVTDAAATETVHCNKAGMYQLGDSYYPILQHILGL